MEPMIQCESCLVFFCPKNLIAIKIHENQKKKKKKKKNRNLLQNLANDFVRLHFVSIEIPSSLITGQKMIDDIRLRFLAKLYIPSTLTLYCGIHN